MSTPISSLPNTGLAGLEEADGPPALEVDASDASLESAESEYEVEAATPSAEASSADSNDLYRSEPPTSGEETESKARTGLLVLILAGLLLGSIAINLKQSRDVLSLETRSSEYQQALAAAVERIDSETARADGAEAALNRVDSAVDLVNERVVGLQEALDGLREATVR